MKVMTSYQQFLIELIVPSLFLLTFGPVVAEDGEELVDDVFGGVHNVNLVLVSKRSTEHHSLGGVVLSMNSLVSGVRMTSL